MCWSKDGGKEGGLYGQSQSHMLGGEGFPQHGLWKLQGYFCWNNVYVIKPSGNDSQSVSSEGRQERLMS